MKQLKTWGVWLLPLVVLLAWTARLHWGNRSGTAVELPITGYDPRDPISGHYLSYRLAMGLKDPCRPTGKDLIDRSEERCLCLSEAEKHEPEWAGACDEKPGSCSLYLQGQCEWSGFIIGVERYYFPEGDAYWLTVVPPRSTIVLSLLDGGKAQLKELRPEGMKYADWIAKQKAEHPRPASEGSAP